MSDQIKDMVPHGCTPTASVQELPRPTLWWRLPGRALSILKREGVMALVRETCSYFVWQKNKLRRLLRLLPGGSNHLATPLQKSRCEYKSVWTTLSQTYEQAALHVLDTMDEERIRATGEETVQWLAESVGIKPDDVVLEIGCGIGRVGHILAPKCKRWIGCDVSPHMLQYARQRLQAFDNVSLVEISGFDLRPIPDASVDLVYCTVVFMHLDEWDRYNYVLEAYRVLRPGGRVFVDNFNLCTDEGWGVFEAHRKIPPEHRAAYISKSSTPQEIRTYLDNVRLAGVPA